MGASTTIYCLQEVTDYLEFERLCHDLMSIEGFSSIEPLGGFSDKGRDAIHVDTSGKTSIFAYSVREDWRAKLAEDASKISKHDHTCDQLVFITTATPTAGERDEAIAFVRDNFGWELELFGAERLRILLDAKHPQIKKNHPHVFPPEFLALQSKIDASTDRDHLFVSFAQEDGALADWLTRKLTAEGYLVWTERFKLLGGEVYPENVDEAMKHRTFRVIGLYSQASLQNPEVMRQRTTALNIGNEREEDFLIPLNVDGVDQDRLDKVTRSLVFIPFNENWASGLQQLLENLRSIHCPRPLPNGRAIATETFLQKDVLSEQTELLFSNCLPIESLPEIIYRFEAKQEISSTKLESLQFKWAFREVHPKSFLSFHQPPMSIADEFKLAPAGNALWRRVKRIDGIWAQNLVSELLRKSLIVKCHEKGLRYCPSTKTSYFPWGLVEKGRLYFLRPDGSETYRQVVGERSFWQPSTGSQKYRYYIAPDFYVVQDLLDDFTVLVRIRVRISNTSGQLLPGRTANSRRKRLCKDWWNKEWLYRLLAVCQYLAEDDKITIGESQKERIIIDAIPLKLIAPLGIDETALNQLSFERSESLIEQDEANQMESEA